MNKLKRFLSTTLVYFIGTVLSKLVSFLLLPLYTGKIPPTEYGSYDYYLGFGTACIYTSYELCL